MVPRTRYEHNTVYLVARILYYVHMYRVCVNQFYLSGIGLSVRIVYHALNTTKMYCVNTLWRVHILCTCVPMYSYIVYACVRAFAYLLGLCVIFFEAVYLSGRPQYKNIGALAVWCGTACVYPPRLGSISYICRCKY